MVSRPFEWMTRFFFKLAALTQAHNYMLYNFWPKKISYSGEKKSLIPHLCYIVDFKAVRDKV